MTVSRGSPGTRRNSVRAKAENSGSGENAYGASGGRGRICQAGRGDVSRVRARYIRSLDYLERQGGGGRGCTKRRDTGDTRGDGTRDQDSRGAGGQRIHRQRFEGRGWQEA